MKSILVKVILILFVPVWLALLFVFGQNTAGYLLNSKEKNVLSLKNVEIPKLYLVQSGSMEPNVPVGSVVFVTPDTTYVNGDIISFDLNGNGKTIVTHRIAFKEFPNGVDAPAVYMTKGDANKDFDPTRISDKSIIGKVRVVVPYLGYLASWAKQPWGFILLVIVPATILIYEELKTIFGEAKKGVKKIKSKNGKHQDYAPYETNWDKNDEKKSFVSRFIRMGVYLVPILGAGLVTVALSLSYFSDTEEASANTFQAGEWSDTTPAEPDCSNPKVVINEVYYDVAPDKGNEGNTTDPDEWIELYNNSDCNVDLKDWTITDNDSSNTISHANKYISAHGFALISKSAATWSYWTVPASAEKIELGEKIGNGLSNGGDKVVLKNNLGVEVDKMSWGTNTDGLNPSCTDVAEGHSLQRNPTGYDTDSASDFVDTNPPTPGS